MLEFLLRAAAVSVSALIFYVAWFVYEDEEAALQSRLEDWWIQLSDLRESALSRQAVFLAFAAQKSINLIERHFGSRTLSHRSVAFAATSCAASFIGTAAFGSVRQNPFFALLVAAFALSLLVASLRFERLRYFVLYGTLSVAMLGAIVAPIALREASQLTDRLVPSLAPMVRLIPILIPAGMALAIAWVLLLVNLSRYALSLTVRATSAPLMIAILLFGVVVATAVLLIPLGIVKLLFLLFPNQETIVTVLSAPFLMAALGNLLTSLMPLLIAAVAGVMLLHRLLWPIPTRAVYALHRYKILESKKSLNALGVTVLGFALAPVKSIGGVLLGLLGGG